MKTFILTDKVTSKFEKNTIFWNTYLSHEKINCFSINKIIEKNSKKIKKKTIKELNNIFKISNQNTFIKNYFKIDNHYNFFKTFIINEKSFYKDKYNDLFNLMKCITLIDLVKDQKICKIIFDIKDENVLIFLNEYYKDKNIKIYYNKSKIFNFKLNEIKNKFKHIRSFL